MRADFNQGEKTMPSPFPGMNPYLEQEDSWQDFHQRFLSTIAEMLGQKIGSEYIVKLEAHIFVHELSAEERRFVGRADVGLSHSGPSSGNTATATLPAPFQLTLPSVDFERYPYIEIRDRQRRSLITVLEMLSPSNKKPGHDRDGYVGERRWLLYGPVNFVELDLLRLGQRLPLPEEIPLCDYCILVRKAMEGLKVGIWPLQLRDPLPTIPIPLRHPAPDISLNLQEALHRVYDAARYQNYIYTGSPEPPLNTEDAAWAKTLVFGNN
jgi:hypothetical protein